MCLNRVLPKEQSDEIIQRAKKRGYIQVFKVCEKEKTGWCFLYSSRWRKGIRKAKNLKLNNGGWYAFLTEKAAKKYIKNWGSPVFIKTCFIKPQWIKRLGRYAYIGKAGIFTHLAFPDWDKGRMTVREFRQMCKGYKGK